MENNVYRIPAIRFDGKRRCKGYLSLFEKQFVFSHDLSCDIYPFDLKAVSITESKAKILGSFQNKSEQIIHISINQKNSDIRFRVPYGTANILNQALNRIEECRVNEEKLVEKDAIAEQNKLYQFRSKAKEKRHANWLKLQSMRDTHNAENFAADIKPEESHCPTHVDLTYHNPTEERNKPPVSNVFSSIQTVRRRVSDSIHLTKSKSEKDQEKKEHNSNRLLYQDEVQRKVVLQRLILLLSQHAKLLEDIENKLSMKTMIDTDDIHRVASIYLNIKNRHQGTKALYNELRKQYGNDVGIS